MFEETARLRAGSLGVEVAEGSDVETMLRLRMTD